VRKPNIPEKLTHVLDEYGTDTVRTILLQGWANPQDLPEGIKRITQPSSDRMTALAWLKRKDAAQAFRSKIIIIATVIGAIAAVIAAIFSVIAVFCAMT
jgi:hypothetical protein